MTSNQIAYKQAVEAARHNRATEEIQMLGTLIDLGEALTHKATAEYQQFNYFTGGLANLWNAETNRMNAETNQGNAFINAFEAVSGRMSAEANLRNADTNRLNAETNIGNMLINAYDADTRRYNAGVNMLNAVINLANAATKATEVSNYYELQSNAQLLDVLKFQQNLTWEQVKNQANLDNQVKIATMQQANNLITSIIGSFGSLVGSFGRLITLAG